MLRTNLAAAALLLSLLGAQAPEPELQLKEGDHKKLAKAISAYFEAKAELSGLGEAYDDLNAEIEKIEKKSDGPVLAMVHDLQQAFQLATEYEGRDVAGRLVEDELQGHYGDKIAYAVQAPKSYNKNRGLYPLVLCIPDEGQSPREHVETWWNEGEAKQEAIVVACAMPEDRSQWTENGSLSAPGGRGSALQVLNAVSGAYAVDKDRVFLAGSGAGVSAAMTIASISPHTFAGVIGLSGDAGDTSPVNFANLPTYFAGGGAQATAFGDASKALGRENCVVKPDATPGEVAAWMLAQRRASTPTSLTFAPVRSYGKKAYWLELEGFDLEGGAKLEAVADPTANTITIDGQGVSSVWVNFNDLLVDMDQPVTVVCNGVEHKELVPRNLRTVLEQVYSSGDPGRIVAARKKYDLLAAEE